MISSVEQIWKDYHQKLHSFVQSRVNDKSVADDILQEVFIRIHSRLSTLKDNNRFQSWVYQITRNAIIDYYRTQKRTVQLSESLSMPETNDEVRKRIASWFLPMIERLPDHYCQALILSEINGLTQKEVALKQGLSLSGAKSRIQRGRAMVKKMLLDCCHFDFDRQGKVMEYQPKDKSCSIKDKLCPKC